MVVIVDDAVGSREQASEFVIDGTSIPEASRMCSVAPLRKKGIGESAEEYRPIALLRVLYKLYEKLI